MKTKSFTLIELLVVIVIIGILAGVIVVSTSSAISKANFAKAQAFSSTVQNELLSDLVSEWTFDTSGSPTEDTWGNNDGTVVGATYQNKASGNCVYGGCYYFNGTGNYIDCGNNSLSDIHQKNTFTLWVKIGSNYDIERFIISKGNQAPALDFYNSRFAYTVSGGGPYLFSTTYPQVGVWYYLTATYDGTTSRIYVNGFLENSFDVVSVSFPTTNLYIATYNSGTSRYFNGSIDEVRIYNRALSSAQIKKNYIAGLDSLLASGSISKEEYQEKIGTLANK